VYGLKLGGNVGRRGKFCPHTAKIFGDANLENEIIEESRNKKIIIERN
jgi:hypothetical protein